MTKMTKLALVLALSTGYLAQSTDAFAFDREAHVKKLNLAPTSSTTVPTPVPAPAPVRGGLTPLVLAPKPTVVPTTVPAPAPVRGGLTPLVLAPKPTVVPTTVPAPAPVRGGLTPLVLAPKPTVVPTTVPTTVAGSVSAKDYSDLKTLTVRYRSERDARSGELAAEKAKVQAEKAKVQAAQVQAANDANMIASLEPASNFVDTLLMSINAYTIGGVEMFANDLNAHTAGSGDRFLAALNALVGLRFGGTTDLAALASQPANYVAPVVMPGPLPTPAVIATPPAVIATPPAVIATPPAVIATPPAVIATPPAVIATPPAVIASPVADFSSLARAVATIQADIAGHFGADKVATTQEATRIQDLLTTGFNGGAAGDAILAEHGKGGAHAIAAATANADYDLLAAYLGDLAAHINTLP